MAGRDPAPSTGSGRPLPRAASAPPELLPVTLPNDFTASLLFTEARSTLTLHRVDGSTRTPVLVEESGCRMAGCSSGRPFVAVVDDPAPSTLDHFSTLAGTDLTPMDSSDAAGLSSRVLEWGVPLGACLQAWEGGDPGRGIRIVESRWEARVDLASVRIGRRTGAPLPAAPQAGPEAAMGTQGRSALEVRLHLRLERDGRTAAIEMARWADPLQPPSEAALSVLESLWPDALRAGAEAFDVVTPPAMECAVVFCPAAAGVLIHEVCGHLLEGDLVAGGNSPFHGLTGQKIAPQSVTLHDDPLAGTGRVKLQVDDEGEGTSPTVLIQEGHLAGYLTSRSSAASLGGLSSGNARRESYRHPALPRMSNLIMEPGQVDPGDLLFGIKRGLLVERLGRGQVDPRLGRFRLEVESARLVEEGRATRPVSGGYLAGGCLDLLSAIDAVGSDQQVDRGAGACIKEDQIVPVGQIFPSVRVSRLRVLPGAGR